MSWFQLDPSTLACRVRSDGGESESLPSLGASIWRGIVGFTVVSVAGFAPWAVFGRWLFNNVGEGGVYGLCAVVFIILSGLLLHRLILGPGSLLAFYKLFSVTFAAYSAAWIAGWMGLGGHPGSVLGLFAGAVVMGWMLTRAFDAQGVLLKVIVVIFVLNALGYFGGSWIEGHVSALDGLGMTKATQSVVAKLLWGVSYGIGFGAALGWAFHLCQRDAREMIQAEVQHL